MNIGLDIMGGDHAPDATIRGAMLAHKEISETDRLFLFGDEEMIRMGLQKAQILIISRSFMPPM